MSNLENNVTNSKSINTIVDNHILPESITDSRGKTYDLTKPTLSVNFGATPSSSLISINDDILKNVLATDLSKDISESFQDILNLTKKVDLNCLNDNSFLGRIKNKFVEVTTKVKSQYVEIEPQISSLILESESHLENLHLEIEQMNNAYIKNQEEYEHYEQDYDTLKNIVENLEDKINSIPKTDENMILIGELEQKLSSLSRNLSTLNGIKYECKQTFTKIRSIQVSKINLIERFELIKNVILPMWKTQMSIALQSVIDKKRLDITNQIDETTNAIALSSSKMIADNIRESTKARNRDAIDVETLVKTTKELQSAIIESSQEEKKSRIKRKQDAILLENSNKEMEKAIAGISIK